MLQSDWTNPYLPEQKFSTAKRAVILLVKQDLHPASTEFQRQLRLTFYSHYYLFCARFIICPQHRGTTYTAEVTAPQTTLLMLFFKLCRMVSSSAAIWLNHRHLNGAMWEVWYNSLVLTWSVSAILHCYSTPYLCQRSPPSSFNAELSSA